MSEKNDLLTKAEKKVAEAMLCVEMTLGENLKATEQGYLGPVLSELRAAKAGISRARKLRDRISGQPSIVRRAVQLPAFLEGKILE